MWVFIARWWCVFMAKSIRTLRCPLEKGEPPPVSPGWLPSQALFMQRWQGGAGQGSHLVSYQNTEPSHVPSSLNSIVSFHTQQHSTNRTDVPISSNHLVGGTCLRQAAVTPHRSFQVQGSFLTPGPPQGTNTSGCSILCQSRQQDFYQRSMLSPNLHSLLGLGAERLHTNRPEASTQCQQKCRHLSQQKNQGLWPL